MRAHLVQYNIAWEDRAANVARVRSLLDAAGVERGDLIVLPEMFDSGFSLRVDVTNDSAGDTQAFLADLARRHDAFVYGGFTVRSESGRGLNRAQIINSAGECLCQYDKIHPFSFGREPEQFDGGTDVVTAPIETDGGAFTACPAICYDLRFPELFRRGLAQGADLFIIGANWPDARTDHWRTLLVARAIENQAYVVGVNRMGADPHLAYDGSSMAVSPRGEVLVDAGDAEGVFAAELSLKALREWRASFPAWKDWKPFLLGGDEAPEPGSPSL